MKIRGIHPGSELTGFRPHSLAYSICGGAFHPGNGKGGVDCHPALPRDFRLPPAGAHRGSPSPQPSYAMAFAVTVAGATGRCAISSETRATTQMTPAVTKATR